MYLSTILIFKNIADIFNDPFLLNANCGLLFRIQQLYQFEI